MADNKIEFGADLKRWLIPKIILTSLVLATVGVGSYLYVKLAMAAGDEAAKRNEREAVEGTPVLVFGATVKEQEEMKDWSDEKKKEWLERKKKDWFEKAENAPFGKKEGAAGVKLTQLMIEGLQLQLTAARPAETRPLPPQIGTLNYDNETQFLIKCRFQGELQEIMKVKDKVFTREPPYEKVVERPVKFGDKVKQGDVLAVFWSVTLGTAKAAFVDAISAVRLSQDNYVRMLKLYKEESALPLGTVKLAERQLQLDNNTLLTAERTLRMWKMTSEEIEALRKEAYEILDALLIAPNGKIARVDDKTMTLVLSSEDVEGTVYKFARDCKFFYQVKRDVKQELTDGPRSEVFKDIAKKSLGATIVPNDEGEAKEIIVGKVRNVLDEVSRWARTEVYVPKFDRINPERQLTIVEKNTNIGDIVDQANYGTWLFRVADLGKLAIWVHPAEEYLPLLREGMRSYYTVSKDLLDQLASWRDEQDPQQRVPPAIVDKVASIEKRKYERDEFVAQLKKQLEPAELKKYQEIILTHMLKKGGLEWEIRFQSDPNVAPLRLHVDLICPSIEPNQHNPMVVGYLPNKDHKYIVGQFVTATLFMPPEENTVEIPTTAVNEYNGQSFIFVEGKEGSGEYFIRRIATVRRYADYTVVRTVLRPQDEKFSEDELKAGRYPLQPLRPGEKVVAHGVVEMTAALETLLTKEQIKFQNK